MKLGGKNKHTGYTIVEVMIVLAISGVMFLIAVTFINGKQEKASFTAGVDSMASEIQDVIEQVNDGQYSDVPLTCVGQAQTGGGASQGTHQDCVFRGKMIHFYAASGTTLDHYEIVSLSDVVSSTGTISPTISGIKGLTVQAAIPQSLQVKKFEWGPTRVNNLNYDLAIIQSAGQQAGGLSGTNAPYVSGAQSIFLAGSNVPNTSSSSGNEWTITGGSMSQQTSVTVCLTDGTQYADISVGQDAANTSSALAVSVQMDGTAAAAC